MTHVTCLAVGVLNFELLMQCLDIVFHALDQLGLVLADSAPDVRAHKQGVESREDAEHLIGILCRAQLVTQVSCDLGFDAVDSFIISGDTFLKINTYIMKICLGKTYEHPSLKTI